MGQATYSGFSRRLRNLICYLFYCLPLTQLERGGEGGRKKTIIRLVKNVVIRILVQRIQSAEVFHSALILSPTPQKVHVNGKSRNHPGSLRCVTWPMGAQVLVSDVNKGQKGAIAKRQGCSGNKPRFHSSLGEEVVSQRLYMDPVGGSLL